MSDDKPLESARARVKLLEHTISELRTQLAASKSGRDRSPLSDRETSESRGSRRSSMRAPAIRPETLAVTTELRAKLEAQQLDLETRTHERDTALAAVTQREREREALRVERDHVRTLLQAAEREPEMLRVERDHVRTMLQAAEREREALRVERDHVATMLQAAKRERDEARSLMASLESELATERSKRPKPSLRPPRHNTAELEAQKVRVQALERQLTALRAEWQTADERAKSAEAKLRQSRNGNAIAIVTAAVERANELARVLEKAAETLGVDDSKPRV